MSTYSAVPLPSYNQNEIDFNKEDQVSNTEIKPDMNIASSLINQQLQKDLDLPDPGLIFTAIFSNDYGYSQYDASFFTDHDPLKPIPDAVLDYCHANHQLCSYSDIFWLDLKIPFAWISVNRRLFIWCVAETSENFEYDSSIAIADLPFEVTNVLLLSGEYEMENNQILIKPVNEFCRMLLIFTTYKIFLFTLTYQQESEKKVHDLKLFPLKLDVSTDDMIIDCIEPINTRFITEAQHSSIMGTLARDNSSCIVTFLVFLSTLSGKQIYELKIDLIAFQLTEMKILIDIPSLSHSMRITKRTRSYMPFSIYERIKNKISNISNTFCCMALDLVRKFLWVSDGISLALYSLQFDNIQKHKKKFDFNFLNYGKRTPCTRIDYLDYIPALADFIKKYLNSHSSNDFHKVNLEEWKIVKIQPFYSSNHIHAIILTVAGHRIYLCYNLSNKIGNVLAKNNGFTLIHIRLAPDLNRIYKISSKYNPNIAFLNDKSLIFVAENAEDKTILNSNEHYCLVGGSMFNLPALICPNQYTRLHYPLEILLKTVCLKDEKIWGISFVEVESQLNIKTINNDLTDPFHIYNSLIYPFEFKDQKLVILSSSGSRIISVSSPMDALNKCLNERIGHNINAENALQSFIEAYGIEHVLFIFLCISCNAIDSNQRLSKIRITNFMHKIFEQSKSFSAITQSVTMLCARYLRQIWILPLLIIGEDVLKDNLTTEIIHTEFLISQINFTKQFSENIRILEDTSKVKIPLLLRCIEILYQIFISLGTSHYSSEETLEFNKFIVSIYLLLIFIRELLLFFIICYEYKAIPIKINFDKNFVSASFFTDNEIISKPLITSIAWSLVKKQIALGNSIDSICMLLSSQCSKILLGKHLLDFFKAHEELYLAKQLNSKIHYDSSKIELTLLAKHQKTILLNNALHLVIKNILTLSEKEILSYCNAFSSLLDQKTFCYHSMQLALAWNSHIDPRSSFSFLIWEKVLASYNIPEFQKHLSEFKLNAKDLSLLDSKYNIFRKILLGLNFDNIQTVILSPDFQPFSFNDPLIHVFVFEWLFTYFTMNQHNTYINCRSIDVLSKIFLQIESPYILPWLKITSRGFTLSQIMTLDQSHELSISSNILLIKDLIWRFHAKKKQFADVVNSLIDLATEKPLAQALSIDLNCRIDYLHLAKTFASKFEDNFLDKNIMCLIDDFISVAKVQKLAMNELKEKISERDEIISSINILLQRLNYELFELSELFNQIVIPQRLFETGLACLECSQTKDPVFISFFWFQILSSREWLKNLNKIKVIVYQYKNSPSFNEIIPVDYIFDTIFLNFDDGYRIFVQEIAKLFTETLGSNLTIKSLKKLLPKYVNSSKNKNIIFEIDHLIKSLT